MAIADYGLREYDDGDVISRFLFLLWSISTDFIHMYLAITIITLSLSPSPPISISLALFKLTNDLFLCKVH